MLNLNCCFSDNSYVGMAELMTRTKNLADNAKKEAAKAYDDALDILTKANNLVIPDLNVDGMKEKSDKIDEEVMLVVCQFFKFIAKFLPF